MASELAEATKARTTQREFPIPAAIPAWKRPLDLLLLVAISPVVLPVMLAIALSIKLLSKGPILFRQHRIGYGGRRFELLKFRTMKVNADIQIHSSHLEQLIKSDAPMTKLDLADPRLIPGGRWLRAIGLDELPQLLNVLRGDMSLVGPRPCTEYEAEKYDASHKRRFGALPGLTGLWQVSGKNRLSFPEMIRLDVCYVENPSLLLDLKIIVKTPLAILRQVEDTVDAQRRTSSEVSGQSRPVDA